MRKIFEEVLKMFQSYTNKLKYSLTNKYIVQLTGQTWYPISHQYLKSLLIMENKTYASWVPDVRSFLWILWVVYFPIEHLCLYNKISYSLPFKCKCYSKCNRISLIIVFDSLCRSSLLHVHLLWLLKILMLWRQRWTAIFFIIIIC